MGRWRGGRLFLTAEAKQVGGRKKHDTGLRKLLFGGNDTEPGEAPDTDHSRARVSLLSLMYRKHKLPEHTNSLTPILDNMH